MKVPQPLRSRRASIPLALLLPAAVLAQGSPAAEAAPKGATKEGATPGAKVRDRSRLLQGIGVPLQIWQIPEASGEGFSDAHAYVICDKKNGEAMIIDAGSRSAPMALKRAADAGLRVALLASTHFHADHTGGNALILQRTAAKMVAPAKEAALMAGEGLSTAEKKQIATTPTPRIDLKAKGGDELKLGDHKIQVIEIPGHSPGGICLHFPQEKLLFTGDSLFKGSVGRVGIPQAAKTAEPLAAAIRSKLLSLPDDTRVLPGHGPLTTIGEERASNPWLREPPKQGKKGEAEKKVR